MRHAIEIAGVLGKPSKLPGYSYGLSAKMCRRGGEMRGVPGSICSECYAMTDWYRTWIPLQIGHARRHAGLEHPRWMDAMALMITSKCVGDHRFFRWHDSGDLQSVAHLGRIVEVARRTPQVAHWIPTREYEMVSAFIENGGDIPENLTVRLSAEMIDSEPDIVRRFPLLERFPTSTVQTASASVLGFVLGNELDAKRKGWIECRAVEARDNTCGHCRACWDRRVTNVSYPQH